MNWFLKKLKEWPKIFFFLLKDTICPDDAGHDVLVSNNNLKEN